MLIRKRKRIHCDISHDEISTRAEILRRKRSHYAVQAHISNYERIKSILPPFFSMGFLAPVRMPAPAVRFLPSANCFAECQKSGTRQRIALGKWLLCRVPGSRQKRGTRHRLPRVTVFGHVLLYRVPVVRHSANFFFWKILCRVPLTRRSAKIQYFFWNVFAECLTASALGKGRN